MDPTPLPCEIYDHLELACVRREPLTITLKTGAIRQGRAIDVGTKRITVAPHSDQSPPLTEYLVVEVVETSITTAIELLLVDVLRIDSRAGAASFKAIQLYPPPAVLVE